MENYISMLNEFAQKKGWLNPIYEDTEVDLDNQKFGMRCTVYDKDRNIISTLTTKNASSKKEAKMNVAKKVYTKIFEGKVHVTRVKIHKNPIFMIDGENVCDFMSIFDDYLFEGNASFVFYFSPGHPLASKIPQFINDGAYETKIKYSSSNMPDAVDIRITIDLGKMLVTGGPRKCKTPRKHQPIVLVSRDHFADVLTHQINALNTEKSLNHIPVFHVRDFRSMITDIPELFEIQN